MERKNLTWFVWVTFIVWFPATVFAAPAFDSLSFGKQSTRCDSNSTRATTAPDGSAFSILFDKVMAEGGTKMRGHGSVRCDVMLKFAAPLEAPAAIQMDVRGAIHLTGRGIASATLTMHGHKQALNFDAKDDAGFQRVIANLPKGAKKLDMTFEAFAKGQYPDATALIAIDSLEVVFEQK